jgi:hypothetical protein
MERYAYIPFLGFDSFPEVEMCPNFFRIGLCISITSFAVLGMGPIAGKLFDNTGDSNYLPMQLFTGVFLISASTLYFITRLFVSRKAIA